MFSWTDRLVEQYIHSEWHNKGRALIPPQAREELLYAARLHIYQSGTHNPVNTFYEKECVTTNFNPIIFDYRGVTPPVFFFDYGLKYGLVLEDHAGGILASIEDVDNNFEV